MGFRTLAQAYKIIRDYDSSTAITLYFLRTLCKTGQLKVLNAGSKYLINMKDLFEFLDMNIEEEKENKKNEKIL